ncbi:hypothetical protein EK21DRAFT_95989 [Setomelanomma holmii]|uniref:Transmembrane protein n=1 Tax=Setomelanomma holmii TaxID=210430 RepID=A0A9P4LTK2_9PLEO|nr:hypothetical protein EK21DRAFT_95989 [Setomelanomma holmii]
MAYQPVGGNNIPGFQPAHLDNIELETRYDPGAYKYTPPPGHPLSHISNTDSKVDDDKKPLFRSTSKSNQPRENKWPLQAQQVNTLTPLRVGLMIFDAILASMPIMFVARIDGQAVSDYGDRLEETLLLSPTIFPLIFAALMGRFFRHLGVYLAERGTTLGRLEQLVGCQSVSSALERQITLRSWSFVGLLSVLVWLLSPLGGQSALRLLGQENKDISSIGAVRFMDPASTRDSVLEGASSINSGRATFSSIFLAALLSSSKYQDTSMDLWGNLKLPLYRNIENATSREWKPVIGHDGQNATYGSLIGVPVVGMPTEGVSNFSIKGRQFDVTCFSNNMTSGDPDDPLWVNMTSTWTLKSDKTRITNGSSTDWPRPILSLSLVDDTENYTNMSIAACTVDYVYLEAKVNCNGTSCGVDSMRKLPLLGDAYTADNDMFTRGNILTNLMSALPRVDNTNVGSATARGSTNAEKWMADPSNFIGATYSNVELYKLDVDTFSQRLTILWNTFHQSTFATTALGGANALPANLTTTGLLVGISNNVTFNSTIASFLTHSSPVYKTNWKWFTFLLLSSLVLLIAAYTGLVLKYITLAPDIVGYASSLTLLNPYVPTPMGGTTLHGLERAALLRDLPVRIGDVCAQEPVGAIAFARNEEGRVRRLGRGRMYI